MTITNLFVVDEVRRSQPAVAPLLEYGKRLLGERGDVEEPALVQHAVLSTDPSVGIRKLSVDATFKIQRQQQIALLSKKGLISTPN